MKKLATALSVLAITALASGVSASASERVSTLDQTGAQVKQIVQEQGSVLLSTGPDLFDRYVANESYCTSGEVAEPAFVPTATSGSEFIGYTCQTDYSNS